MIAILLNDTSFEQDIRELLMAFYPGSRFSHREEDAGEAELILRGMRKDEDFTLRLVGPGEPVPGEFQMIRPSFENRLEAKSQIKRTLYHMLCSLTGRTLPWGTLTGIRPTKIALSKLNEGWEEAAITDYMRKTYEAGEEKIRLCVQVAGKERTLLRTVDCHSGYSLYVGIPFCPTTCLYCSFTSFPIDKWEGRTGLYLEAIFREMDYAAEKMRGRPLSSVYIGGGTPTSLSAEDLNRLLFKMTSVFPCGQAMEFTVEAGRPDSITAEKLKVLKEYGITRISINPQTMKQGTLDLIGRHHTVEQVKETFQLARELGFDNINMDLIVGLPGETIEDVEATLKQVEALGPDGLTVHSLAVKRAARLSTQKEQYGSLKMVNTQEMIDATARSAARMGMEPYYLYRQKNMAGNFENVGYAVPGRECIYNVLIMEEQQTIIACGAGTTTKVNFSGNRTERAENVKEAELYISRVDEMIGRKEKLLTDV